VKGRAIQFLNVQNPCVTNEATKAEERLRLTFDHYYEHNLSIGIGKTLRSCMFTSALTLDAERGPTKLVTVSE